MPIKKHKPEEIIGKLREVEIVLRPSRQSPDVVLDGLRLG